MIHVWGHFFSRLRQSCETTSLAFKSRVNGDADRLRLIYPFVLNPLLTSEDHFFCGAENIEKCFKLLGMISLRRLSRVMGALFWTRQIVFYRHHYSVLWAPGNLIHSPLEHVDGKSFFSTELLLLNVSGRSEDFGDNVISWDASLMSCVSLLCIRYE